MLTQPTQDCLPPVCLGRWHSGSQKRARYHEKSAWRQVPFNFVLSLFESGPLPSLGFIFSALCLEMCSKRNSEGGKKKPQKSQHTLYPKELLTPDITLCYFFHCSPLLSSSSSHLNKKPRINFLPLGLYTLTVTTSCPFSEEPLCTEVSPQQMNARQTQWHSEHGVKMRAHLLGVRK